MTIHIQTPGFTAKAELIKYVNEKVEKLERFNSEIISGEVSLRQEHSDTGNDKICEIRMVIRGNDLLAGAQCKTFEGAVSKASEVIREQMTRKKTRLIAARHNMIL